MGKQVKGHAKEVAGIVTGNEDLKSEGTVDRRSDEAEEQAEHAKRTVEGGLEKAKHVIDDGLDRAKHMIDTGVDKTKHAVDTGVDKAKGLLTSK
ncbi:MAG: CsbD family protein [Candidatus Nanopelagicales bacterium]